MLTLKITTILLFAAVPYGLSAQQLPVHPHTILGGSPDEHLVVVDGHTADGFLEFDPIGDLSKTGIQRGHSYFVRVGVGFYSENAEDAFWLSNYFSRIRQKKPCEADEFRQLNLERGVDLSLLRRGSKIYLCIGHEP